MSREETRRAASFQSAEARATFVAGRSGVRRVASLYSNIPAGDLVLETDVCGKPVFANTAIRFNLSHSGAVVVAAFSESAVGIDVEARGRCRDFAGIANRFFHPAEAAAIRRSEDEGHFLRIWTGKEAMLKLSGEGISGGLSDARPGDEGVGVYRGKRVRLVGFSFGNLLGAVASFQPVEVKGWFRF
ncbi:MAG: 4'-phosphopantetheinyl transferase superfamily protein [Terrimicrobiaceae bacterium]